MCDAGILVATIVNVPLERIGSAESLLAKLAWVARRVRSVVRLEVAFAIVSAGEGFGAFVAWEPLYTPRCARWNANSSLAVGRMLPKGCVVLRGVGLLGLHGSLVVGIGGVQRLLRITLVLWTMLTHLGVPWVLLPAMVLHPSRSLGCVSHALGSRIRWCS